MKRKLLSIVATIAVVVPCWYVVDAVRTSLRAENCLHACITISAVLEQHVRVTDGQWPASWDELRRTVPVVDSAGMYKWPQDVRAIREFVFIDFNADPAMLAQATLDTFDAVRPIGPCFTSYDRHFELIIVALRESRAQ